MYPDELVALISAASLYPLQIIEAHRFLEQRKTKPDLEPKSDWDGSVVSLLNYPEIITMMSEDLDWTQAFGDALVRGDRTIQEIASRHKVHPNQMSTWKRQAVDGLGGIFSGGAERGQTPANTSHRPTLRISAFPDLLCACIDLVLPQ